MGVVDYIARYPVRIAMSALALVVIASMSLTVVPETKQGLILSYGQIERVVNPWQPRERFGATGAGLVVRIPFVGRQLAQLRNVFDLAEHLFDRLDHGLEGAQLADDRLRRLRAIPEARFRHLVAQIFQLLLLARQVKASPGCLPPGPRSCRSSS